MTIGFFERFCNELQKPLNQVNIDKRAFIFLEELIFKNSKIFINLSSEEIIGYCQNPEKGVTSLQLQRLRMNGVGISSCKDEIEIFRQKNHTKFDLLPSKPDFILLSETKEFCKEVSEEFGIFCISNSFTFEVRNSFVQVKIINKDQDINLSDLTSFLLKPNALVIEDPHIFNKDVQGNFFCKLVESFRPKHSHLPSFYLTLICANEKGINIDTVKNKIQKIYPEIVFECYLRTKDSIHDRNIYSNTFWISCDYGFAKKYGKPTKWTFYPLGIYYSEFQKRLKQCTAFIYNEKRKSNNPLINFQQ